MGVKDPKWQSRTNPDQPNVNEASPRGRNAPIHTRPNSPDSTRNRVIVSEGKPSKSTSTFKAPRSGGDGGSPMTCGYTKLGKV